MIKRTAYLEQIRPFMHTELIKIFTGIRRSGKSTLMKQVINDLLSQNIHQNQIVYMNFEDFRMRQYKDADALYEYLDCQLIEGQKTYVFLDEIQEVDHFEHVVNSLHATRHVDLYLTGSNSKMLSGEYATLLAGRYKTFKVFPFSFKEMCQYHGNNDIKALFAMYVAYGGFPVIQGFDNVDQKLSIMRDLYDSIVIRDIVHRNRVNNLDILDKYMGYLLNTIASPFSAQNIIRYFKNEGRTISKETLYNYIAYAKDVYFIYSAKRFDLKGKRLLTTNETYFVNDQGLRATKFDNTKDIEKVLENIVYFELLRRGYDVTIGNIDDLEIDFIASKNNIIHYYQVSYIMETPKTREREFGSLLKIKDQYPKYVLSMDEIDFSQDGIIHQNIIDFLLG
ncbi:MAG: ATP-binding protein [Acholeplasmataceae bacterium]|nr:ATP-binding protein [Acholeplasmataceae bacterium]